MQTRPLIALENTAQAKEAEAILRACVHCGFCNASCPTYQLLGDERDGPRGRVYLIKGVGRVCGQRSNPATFGSLPYLPCLRNDLSVRGQLWAFAGYGPCSC